MRVDSRECANKPWESGGEPRERGRPASLVPGHGWHGDQAVWLLWGPGECLLKIRDLVHTDGLVGGWGEWICGRCSPWSSREAAGSF